MSAGLFQRLFAAAEGGLGSTRVRPQAAPTWAAEAPSIEAPEADALIAPGLAKRAEAAEPLRAVAAPSIRPGPAGAPPRLQPLDGSVLAAEAGPQAAAAARSERGATRPGSTPLIAQAPAARPAQAAPGAIQSPPLLQEPSHAPSLPLAQASDSDTRTDPPPALLQPSRPIAVGAASPLLPSTAPSRTQPAPAAAAPAAEPTVVHVSIGRVEFLPAAPVPPARPRAATRAAPRVPLADYLSGKAR
jgi:hypothetical protein